MRRESEDKQPEQVQEIDAKQLFNLGAGTDYIGSFYQNIEEMWDVELKGKDSKTVVNPVGGVQNWYGKAADYWNNADSTYNGVLGGYEILNKPDIQHSEILINVLFDKHGVGKKRAIDCGAGIGRVSKELLIRKFEKVDVVDQCAKYVEKAKELLGNIPQAGHFLALGLQELDPPEIYDCIWIQWVSSHLTDEDFVKFLVRCKKRLANKGVIIIKENHAKKGFIVDKDDYSVTRCEEMYKVIFQQSGLHIILETTQPNFPQELYIVKAYVLQPLNQ